MASLNKVQIIGSLGKDPEISYTPSGMAVARFSVATSDKWTDKATGEKKEKTEWHRIVVFNKQAENCVKYLFKGSPVYVEGKLQTSSYEKDGITRYNTDIISNDVQFLGQKPQSQQQPQNQGYQNQQYQKPPANNQNQENYNQFTPPDQDYNENIPF